MSGHCIIILILLFVGVILVESMVARGDFLKSRKLIKWPRRPQRQCTLNETRTRTTGAGTTDGNWSPLVLEGRCGRRRNHHSSAALITITTRGPAVGGVGGRRWSQDKEKKSEYYSCACKWGFARLDDVGPCVNATVDCCPKCSEGEHWTNCAPTADCEASCENRGRPPTSCPPISSCNNSEQSRPGSAGGGEGGGGGGCVCVDGLIRGPGPDNQCIPPTECPGGGSNTNCSTNQTVSVCGFCQDVCHRGSLCVDDFMCNSSFCECLQGLVWTKYPGGRCIAPADCPPPPTKVV